MRLALIALVFACSAKSIVFAQTGPGGVGNAAGRVAELQGAVEIGSAKKGEA